MLEPIQRVPRYQLLLRGKLNIDSQKFLITDKHQFFVVFWMGIVAEHVYSDFENLLEFRIDEFIKLIGKIGLISGERIRL